jgi:selenocysteine lyase/cysteine desulfurase/tRNA(Ile)-lysidine synthase TilS/MesJ
MSNAALSRSFYGADVDESPPEPLAECEEDDGDEGPLAPHLAPRAAAALAAVRRDLVGVGAPFRTPLGVKRLCYADWAATGRALRQVEAQVRSRVLPFHGNTHVTSSLVGDQSSCYLSEARQAVAQAVNARVQYSSSASGGDALFFCGTGATACANKLLTLLRLHLPLPPGTPPAQRPVVLVSEKEHHSNLLPWRESCATVVTVPDAPCGTKLCLSALQAALRATAGDGGSRRLRLACFSAASNVTGCCEDVQGVTALLHSHGCLAVWDYAGASTGLTVDCNPVPRPPLAGGLLCARDVALDAAFLSAHKLPGGPACPGVLLLKRRLLSARHPPASPGGGTVFFVTARSHSYVSDSEEREQGGTRDVIGACRTALALRARDSVPAAARLSAACAAAQKVDSSLRANPRVCVLGPPVTGCASAQTRLPTCSFLVRGPPVAAHAAHAAHAAADAAPHRWLHHGFVCALLNDLFGVQARPGCACAGPYGLSLLGISDAHSAAIEQALRSKTGDGEALRPGYCRISFSWCSSDDEIAFTLAAVHAVADHGWRLLPAYRMDPASGEWKHKSRATRNPERKWLAKADTVACAVPDAAHVDLHQLRADWAACLSDSARVFEDAAPGGEATSHDEMAAHAALRWFTLPAEAAALLLAQQRASGGAKRACPVGTLEPGAERGSLDAADAAHMVETPHSLGPVQPVSYPRAAVDVADYERGVAALMQCSEAGDCNDAKRYAEPCELAQLAHAPTSAPRGATAESSCSDCDSVCASDDDGEAVQPTAPPSTAPGRVPPPRKLLASVARTVASFAMLRKGDRVLLGLSGGKDSLSLLHILLHMRARSPVKFHLECATVDPGAEGFDPRPLIPYVQSLGVPYHFLPNTIMADAAAGAMDGDSICAFCARMKRGALYSCARQHGCNVLALGQHADDVAESLLLSAFHNGALRTMKAHYTVSGVPEVRVIRPLVAVRERALRDFAYASGLPVIADNCPACFEAPKERRRIKGLLRREERVFPNLFANLGRALAPILDGRVQTLLRALGDQLHADQNANKIKHKHRTDDVAEAETHEPGEFSGALQAVSDEELIAEIGRRGGLGVSKVMAQTDAAIEEAKEEAEQAGRGNGGACPLPRLA